uniref:Chromosome transmission fidelity protein 18 homolog n=1 Tax=Hirondellea gigas TaxID=1518452 RepID=A0A6A7G3E8_9CRUS
MDRYDEFESALHDDEGCDAEMEALLELEHEFDQQDAVQASRRVPSKFANLSSPIQPRQLPFLSQPSAEKKRPPPSEQISRPASVPSRPVLDPIEEDRDEEKISFVSQLPENRTAQISSSSMIVDDVDIIAESDGAEQKRKDEFDKLWDAQREFNQPQINPESARKRRRTEVPRERYVFDRAPPGEYFTITAEDGDRLYVEVDSDFVLQTKISDSIRSNASQYSSLLSIPIRELIDTVEEEATERALEERMVSEERNLPAAVSEVKPPDQLWVDKYAPKSFLELLSDEKINREVLQWLKEWDITVFGEKRTGSKRRLAKRSETNIRQIPKAPIRPASVFTSRLAQFSGSPKPETVKRPEEELENGPEHKILLLSGPPGTGKTTLAHIVARQAGYRPMEINASDDRSASKLRDRIISATQMQNVLGEKKPNLVIIDEIDGIDGAANNAINEIVRIANAGKLNNNSSKSSKKKKLRVCKRPIICICNDPYARSLRPLREVAKVFAFKPPSEYSLSHRLQVICRKEHLQADLRTLSQLGALTSFDVRSCLNTLQFIRRRTTSNAMIPRRSSKLTSSMLASMSLGHKDITKNLLQVLEAVFSKRKLLGSIRGKRKSGPKSAGAAALAALRQLAQVPQNTAFELPDSAESVPFKWQKLHNLILSLGDHRKVLEGIHENYTKASFNDPTFEKMVTMADWLCNSDIFLNFQQTTQQYMLHTYIPYSSIVIHEICSQDRPFRVKFPDQEWRLFEKRRRHQSIVDNFLSDSGGLASGRGLRRFTTAEMAVLDVIPYLLSIVSPKLKSVPIHQMDESQRTSIRHLVDTMISCNLTFKHSGGLAERVLDPPIDQLLHFDRTPSNESNVFRSYLSRNTSVADQSKPKSAKSMQSTLTDQLKDIISHEIELELMRRVDKTNRDENPVAKKDAFSLFGSQSSSQAPKNLFFSPRKKNSAISSSSSSSPKKTPKKTPTGIGRFGAKVIAPSMTQSPSRKKTFMSRIQMKMIEKVRYPIHFRFVEGHTHAVRRKVFVRDFL